MVRALKKFKPGSKFDKTKLRMEAVKIKGRITKKEAELRRLNEDLVEITQLIEDMELGKIKYVEVD